MRFGFNVIRPIWQKRRSGNKGAYVLLNVRSFLRGYNLFAPLQSQQPKRMFCIQWGRA